MITQSSDAHLAREKVESFTNRVQTIRQSLHQVVVGQDVTIDLLLTCALTGSHALLVGVPGLAKTLMVKALAANTDLMFVGQVDGDVASDSGLELAAGEVVVFSNVGNLMEIWLDSAVDGEGVAWLLLSI